MPSALSREHQKTYDAIFENPVTHDLEWSSLLSLFRKIGNLDEEASGKYAFTRGGNCITMQAHGAYVNVEEVMNIRHFLENCKMTSGNSTELLSRDLMVVLDHSGARIYDIVGETSKPVHVEPFNASGHDRQVHNPLGDSGGKQGSSRKRFYEAIGKKLEGGDRILMIGDGQGASSEVDHFLAELERNHPQGVHRQVLGKQSLDLHHLSEKELIAKGRQFFADKT